MQNGVALNGLISITASSTKKERKTNKNKMTNMRFTEIEKKQNGNKNKKIVYSIHDHRKKLENIYVNTKCKDKQMIGVQNRKKTRAL